MLRARTLAALALGTTVVVACASTALPGTQLGTFKVTAQSETNTCGLGAPNPWTFDAELSQSGSTIYWSWMDGSPLLSGSLNAASQVSITDTVGGNVDGTDAALGPCTMDRYDDLELDLGSGSFTGTLTYSFTVASGADCSDQLVASGGQYDALPCTVSYTVTASKQ
jgi:hypothetical protein